MAKTKDVQYFVRWVQPEVRTFTYFGADYDQGQLIVLQHPQKDEQLLRLGFLALVTEAQRICQCGSCGAHFRDELTRDGHGRRRHKDRFTRDPLDVAVTMASPAGDVVLHDVTGDADERRLMTETPLYLDQTVASRK